MITIAIHGWFRICALQAAAFILSSSSYYADKLVMHICCGQSWARSYVIESASIILPLLTFDNKYLKCATELNIKFSQMLFKENVTLYLSAKGNGDKKRFWLEHQIRIAKYDHQKESLKELIKPRIDYYQTGYFIKSFNDIKSYFIFKILSQAKLSRFQPGLFDDNVFDFNKLILKE